MLFKAIKGKDNSIYLKKEGESFDGIFRGDVYEFKCHWIDKEQEFIDCIESTCDLCLLGSKNQFRFRVNVIVRDTITNKLQCKIYEGNWHTYKRLSEFNDKFKLENHAVKIYKGIVPDYGKLGDMFENIKDLTSAELINISKISLLDITYRKTKVQIQTQAQDQSSDFDSSNDIPF